MVHPADPEALIDENDFERDERLPYWADLWPSSHALAAEVAALDGAHRRLLELGCGLGLVAAAGLAAGFDVLATDYYKAALPFARLNGLRNAGRAPEVRHVDWRALPPDLGRFPVVVASDVLYERTYAELVADVFAQTLAPDGDGWLADPGRIALNAFVAACERRGLAVTPRKEVPFQSGSIRQRITIFQLQWRVDSTP